MSYMSQNFRLFHVSNLSVRNFRIFLLMYTGSQEALAFRGTELAADLLGYILSCRRAPTPRLSRKLLTVSSRFTDLDMWDG